jgi:hypothetical protein
MSKTPLRGLEDSGARQSQVIEIGGPCRSRTYDQEIKRELSGCESADNSSVSHECPLSHPRPYSTSQSARGDHLRGGATVLYVHDRGAQAARYVARHGSRHQIATKVGGKTTLVYAPVDRLLPEPQDWKLFKRLLARIEVDAIGCWIWQLSLRTDGYGQVSHKHGKPTAAHRRMWFALYGENPWDEGKYICHSCDVRPCINPLHLWKGTPLDNNRDRDAKGRNPQLNMTHCYRGHEFTPETTRVRGKNKACRICLNAAVRRGRKRRRIEAGKPERAKFLTPETKAYVLELAAAGMTYEAISAEIGASGKHQIYNVVHAERIAARAATRRAAAKARKL